MDLKVMKQIINVTAITLMTALSAISQSVSFNQQFSSGVSDSHELTVEQPHEITVDKELRMYALVPHVRTNHNALGADMSVTVTHADKIAQKPDVFVAPLSPEVIRELYRLRSTYVALMNRVAYESADRRVEGMPRGINRGYGSRTTNIFKKSERDKENSEHRAEKTAVFQLKQVLTKRFNLRTFAMTEHVTHHYKLPDGRYILCVMQRVKNPQSKALLGSKWAIWWTTLTIEKEYPIDIVLDESNAITWREIFSVD